MVALLRSWSGPAALPSEGAPPPSASRTPAPADEIALLRDAEASGQLVTTVVVAAEEPIEAGAIAACFAGLGETPTRVCVRTPFGEDSASATLVALELAGPLTADCATSCAEALFGVSPSRFAASLAGREGDSEAAEQALSRVSATTGVSMPPPSWARVAFVAQRLRGKAPHAPILVQAIDADAGYAACTSRDPRTGAGPVRVQLVSSARAMLDMRAGGQPLATERGLSEACREAIRQIVERAESSVHRPLKVAVVAAEDGSARAVIIHALRRVGVAAFAIAADLHATGAVSDRGALGIVEPRDMALVPASLELPTGAESIRGIAAGSGVAEGFVCLSADAAESMARCGLPPILFTHDLLPEDIEALRGCAGLVTVRGGLTGEAAVMARGLSKPCVASGALVGIAEDGVRLADGRKLRIGARVTIDGSSGVVARGAYPRTLDDLPPAVSSILALARAAGGDDVFAHVSHPAHAVAAARLGAHGVRLDRVALLYEIAGESLGELEGALRERATDVMVAARGGFEAIEVGDGPIAMPAPFGRDATDAELGALTRAIAAASAASQLPVLPVSIGSVSARVDDILAERIAAARRPLH